MITLHIQRPIDKHNRRAINFADLVCEQCEDGYRIIKAQWLPTGKAVGMIVTADEMMKIILLNDQNRNVELSKRNEPTTVRKSDRTDCG